MDDPGSHDQVKKLIVYVEMDRCTGDAVAHVTGVKLGKRSRKIMDHGITPLPLSTSIEEENIAKNHEATGCRREQAGP